MNLNLDLGGRIWRSEILVVFGFKYGSVQVAIKNLREAKLIYSFPDSNIFVRFVQIQIQILYTKSKLNPYLNDEDLTPKPNFSQGLLHRNLISFRSMGYHRRIFFTKFHFFITKNIIIYSFHGKHKTLAQ